VRNRQLKQDIPQKNADTKQSNAVTPGGQPVPASKRQPKRILGLEDVKKSILKFAVDSALKKTL
jgi:hypothetical protein